MNTPAPCDIEVQVQDPRQLFNSMDPSPFIERDLDPDAEDYIVSWAGEYPHAPAYRLIVHLRREPPETGFLDSTGEGIRNYFAYRAAVARRNYRAHMREARLTLVIGLAFLAACLGASNLLGSMPDSVLARLGSEGLLIAGWVAMWRPMEDFLYGWWPVLRRRRLLGRLSRMVVEFRPGVRAG